MGRLEGKRALVTGASSGIGAETARLLASEGADVALLARGDGLGEVAGRVRGEGRRAFELRADVSDRESLERAVDDAARMLGGLDVVVSGAAAGAFGAFREMPPEDFERCVEVTFGGNVNTIRAALPHLERSEGTLVVIGSAADSIALTLMSPYVAAKHALAGFLESLRAELRAAGTPIEICEVRPGAVDTPFWRHLTHEDGLTPPEIPPLLAYAPESVAQAVVACAIEPRPSVTVGGSTVVLQLAQTLVRPLTERALSLVARLGRGLASEDDATNALWSPSGDGTVEGGLGGRSSLLAALRLRGARPQAKR